MTRPDADQTAQSSSIPPVPPGSAAQRIPFDAAAITAIAAELGIEAAPAPFGAQAHPAWRLVVPLTGAAVIPGADPTEPVTAQSPGVVTRLIVWPGMGRVDVANPMASVTMTGVVVVDLIPGIEAIFRSPEGSLTVARNGRVMARTGPSPATRDTNGIGPR
ncbi:MAG TPA: hypothetical protein VGT61_01230 [Thermomicrobiales bacterium]|jgi:hypothetical protein|nr:hypothetical protein [Thermomicrobiales bacterium]